MKLFCKILIAILAVISSGCAASSPTRKAVTELHDKLEQSRVNERYPEDYQTFVATMVRAEALADQDRTLQSEHAYQLALLRGRQLETKAAKPVVARAAPTTVRPRPAPAVPAPPSPPDDLDEDDDDDAPPAVVLVESAPAEPPRQEPPVTETASAAKPVIEPVPARPSDPRPKIAAAPAPVEEQETAPRPDLPGDARPTADMKHFIGGRGYYTVRKGDTFKQVCARLGVDSKHLAKINNLDPKAPLRQGQVIAYDNRKIVPSALKNGIVINIPDRTLYLLKNGEVRTSYPVALGKPPRPQEDEDWSTPTGRFTITAKTKDPVWRVPQSIQDEMEERGKQPVKEVPPGKGNPLGQYAMKTTLSGIMIHSTNSPSSINTYTSHGCIRVMPEHMEKLFPAVEPHTTGIIVYQPVKLVVSPNGSVFLEVNRDVYDRYKGNLESEVRKLISRHKVDEKVDWGKVDELLRKKSGIPQEITLDSVRTASDGRVKTVSAGSPGAAVP